jgi:arylsulfatase A-like enzyme
MFWVAPLFELFVFLALALAIQSAKWFIPQLQERQATIWIFTFYTIYEWLRVLSTGHIDRYARVVLTTGLVLTIFRVSRSFTWLQFWKRGLAAVPALFTTALLFGFLLPTATETLYSITSVSPPNGSPNLIIIVVDALRADHLSAYGYLRQTSPNLDRISAEGILFENAFAASSWTLPSHASLLTGLYPNEHRAQGPFFARLGVTIGDVLRRHGYRTGAFSANKYYFTSSCGLAVGFSHFEDYSRSLLDLLNLTPYSKQIIEQILVPRGLQQRLSRKRAPDVTKGFLEWARQDRSRPFFAFLNYFDVHDPYTSPYRNRFLRSGNQPGGLINSVLGRIQLSTSSEVASEIDSYDGGISYLDENLGTLIRTLQESGLSENTIVAITADHGEAFGEHGLFAHEGTLYRELIQIPLIFWSPRLLPAGIRVSQPVSNSFLASTMLGFSGRNATVFPGLPLSRLWTTPPPVDWPAPIAELSKSPTDPDERSPRRLGWLKTLITPEWQYISHETLPAELYAWKADSAEARNLAATSSGSAIVNALGRQLDSYKYRINTQASR